MEKEDGVPLAASPAAMKHDVLQRAFPDLMRLEDFLVGARGASFSCAGRRPRAVCAQGSDRRVGLAPSPPDDALQKEPHQSLINGLLTGNNVLCLGMWKGECAWPNSALNAVRGFFLAAFA